MSAQHTPGNWRPGMRGGTVVSDKPLPNYNLNGGHDEVEYYGGHLIAESIWRAEDARLIAAAPDLLEASETALSYIEAVCFNTPNPKKRKNYADCASILRAAIAKAKGVQQ